MFVFSKFDHGMTHRTFAVRHERSTGYAIRILIILKSVPFSIFVL